MTIELSYANDEKLIEVDVRRESSGCDSESCECEFRIADVLLLDKDLVNEAFNDYVAKQKNFDYLHALFVEQCQSDADDRAYNSYEALQGY